MINAMVAPLDNQRNLSQATHAAASLWTLAIALFVILALSCGFGFSSPAWAEDAEVITPDTLDSHDSSEAEEVIRVGYFPFSGYQDINPNGSMSGYGYDFLQKIGIYLDGVYEYLDTDGSYSEALDMLANGELDLVTSVSKTPEREELFLFSDQPIGTNSTIFTVKAGNDDVVAGDYSTYDGLTIGMIDGNSKNDVFAEFAEENGFSYNSVYYEEETQLVEALQNGEVEAAVTGSLRKPQNEWIIETLSPSPFYVVTSKDNPELMAEINNAIEELDAHDPDWRSELSIEYYTEDGGEGIMLSAQERDLVSRLQESGEKLTVLFNPDRYPYSYFEDGKARGIMPEIFDTIAAKIGIPYAYVETQNQTEYFQLRSEDKVDIVIDFLDNYYTAEQEGYKITEPYLDSGFTRLVLAGNEQNGMGDSIATIEDSQNLINFIENRYPDQEILYYPNMEEAIDAVRNGEADSTVIYYYSAEDAIHRDMRNELSFNMLPDAMFSYCMAVNIHEPTMLVNILDKGINSLGETGVTSIINNNTGTGGHHLNISIGDFLYNNPMYMMIIVAALLLLCFAIFMLVVRSRNQHRLQATVDEVSAKYEKQQEVLSEALSMSEQANRAKSTFLNSMSHDIRTPMNAIIGFSNLASEHIDDRKKVKEYLGKIATSSNHLLSLINDVLDMSRIESGKVNIENSLENLNDILKGINDIVETEVHNRSIKFTIQKDIKHCAVYCDRLHLNQVLLNLLSNAIKFTPEGGSVLLVVREKRLADDELSEYTFVVSDTGIGMNQEFLETIFDPFTRERTSTVSGTQGTGLGMAITKNILDMMDGSIDVSSAVGAGTTFTVRIPMRFEKDTEVQDICIGVSERAIREADEADEAERLLKSFSGHRLLLVEDNLFNRELALDILSDAGFETDTAEDGVEAVDIIKNTEPGYYDAVLMDIQMPVMDGYTATQEIRALGGERSKVPIIALTADAFEEDRIKALEAGMDGHLTKPVEVDKLMKILRSIVDEDD